MYRLLGSKTVDLRQVSSFRTIVGQVSPNPYLDQMASQLAQYHYNSANILVQDLSSGVNEAVLRQLARSTVPLGARCLLIVRESDLLRHSRGGRESQLIEIAHSHGAILELSEDFFKPEDKYALTFIDVLKAALSSCVYVVSNSKSIRGGARYTVAYAEHLHRLITGVNARNREFRPTYAPFRNNNFTEREQLLRKLVYELTGR